MWRRPRVGTGIAVYLVLLTTAVACSSGIEQGGRALRSVASPSRTATSPTASPSAEPSSQTPPEGPAIEVERPRPDTQVLSPTLVRGTAVTASGQVSVRILDTDGTELAAIIVEVDCGAGCRGGFEAQLAFFVPSARRGTVRVSEPGPDADASRPVEVSVTLIPGV